jgi:hypothetical protein
MYPDDAAEGCEIEYESTDPALEEIWAIRERTAAEFGYDVDRIAQAHMEYEKRFGDRILPPPDRKKVERPTA